MRDEQELFEEIDRWVAFERRRARKPTRSGPSCHGRLAGHLPEVQAILAKAAQRVFDDVVATSPIRWKWGISVHEDEIPFPDMPDGVTGIWATTQPAGWAPDRRELALPELWLEAGNWAISLPEPDAKVLTVPATDPRWAGIADLADLPSHLLDEIAHFFNVYKELEPDKGTEISEWQGRAEAERAITEAQARYVPTS